MTVQNIVNLLLTTYAPVALPIAIVASIALMLLPSLYIAARGQAIRRSAEGTGVAVGRPCGLFCCFSLSQSL